MVTYIYIHKIIYTYILIYTYIQFNHRKSWATSIPNSNSGLRRPKVHEQHVLSRLWVKKTWSRTSFSPMAGHWRRDRFHFGPTCMNHRCTGSMLWFLWIFSWWQVEPSWAMAAQWQIASHRASVSYLSSHRGSHLGVHEWYLLPEIWCSDVQRYIAPAPAPSAWRVGVAAPVAEPWLWWNMREDSDR